MDVAIFWDYENCPAPSNASGCNVVNSIRLIAKPYGRIKSFKAYLAITDENNIARAVKLRSELQASGVSLIDCPHNGRKEVADKMIIVDMLTYAIDNPVPSTVILITGDRDFAYPVSTLRLRQYEVILITLSNAHSTLKSQASLNIDWVNDVLKASVQPVKSSNTFTHGQSSGRDQSLLQKRSLSHQSIQTEDEELTRDRLNQAYLLRTYLREASATRCRHHSVSSHRPDCQQQWESRLSNGNSPLYGAEATSSGVEFIDQVAVCTPGDMNSVKASRTPSPERLSALQASVENDMPAEDNFSPPEISHIAPVISNSQTSKPLPTSFDSADGHETDTIEDVSDAESYFSCPTRPASRVHTLLASPFSPDVGLQHVEPFESETPSAIVDYPRSETPVESSSIYLINARDICKSVSFAVSSVDPEPIASTSSTPTAICSVPAAVSTKSIDCACCVAPSPSALANSVVSPSTLPPASITTLHDANANISNIASPVVVNGNTLPDIAFDCICCLPPARSAYTIHSYTAHNAKPKQIGVNSQAGPSRKTPVIKLTGENAKFQTLVDVFLEEKESFPDGLDRTQLCEALVKKDPNVYIRADLKKFRSYLKAAICAGIVAERNKGDPMKAKIFLLEQNILPRQSTKLNDNSSTPVQVTKKMIAAPVQKPASNPTTTAVQKRSKLTSPNAKYQILVDTLLELRHKHPSGVPRSDLAQALHLKNNPRVYKKFKTYISSAINAGIICEKTKKQAITLAEKYA